MREQIFQKLFMAFPQANVGQGILMCHDVIVYPADLQDDGTDNPRAVFARRTVDKDRRWLLDRGEVPENGAKRRDGMVWL